jgi:hypothetical protein
LGVKSDGNFLGGLPGADEGGYVKNIGGFGGSGGGGFLGSFGGLLGGLGIIGGAFGAGGSAAGIGGIAGMGGAIAMDLTGFGLGAAGSSAGLGATLGSVVPIVGTIIGVIFGALIGALLKKSTEIKVYGSQFMPEIESVAHHIQTGLLDAYVTSGLKDVAGFTASSNAITQKYLARAGGFQVFAGSSEDVQNNTKRLLTDIIPTELLHLLIGQQRTGGRDLPGISGASTYGGELDPTAPINMMLAGLGFTSNAIKKIAGQIDTKGPEAFTQWLNELAGTMRAFTELAATGRANKEAAAGIISGAAHPFGETKYGSEVLTTSAGEVEAQFRALRNYGGTDVTAKIGEAQQAAAAFWSSQRHYLESLKAMQDGISASVEGQKRGMTLELMSPQDQKSFYVTEIQELMAKLGAAKDTATFQSIFGQIQQDVAAIWSVGGKGEQTEALKEYLSGILDQAKAVSNAWVASEASGAVAGNDALLAAMEEERIAFGNLDEALVPVTAGAHSAATATDALATATTTAATSATALTTAFDSLRESVTASSSPGARGGTSPSITISVEAKTGTPEDIAAEVASNVTVPLKAWVRGQITAAQEDLVTYLRAHPNLLVPTTG